MSISPRLSLITLGVADLPRARALYGALGWRESSFSMDRVAFFSLQMGIIFALVTREAIAAGGNLMRADTPVMVA